ncbi:conserved hypothetical protein [Burkholderiales bacterium]|nr:conserved hypothetical protein [Burkholderiales bacterium]
MAAKAIVFVHGMYMTPACREKWRAYFAPLGYQCVAPAWPGRDRPVAVLRKEHPDSALGRLTLRAVLDHFEGEIRALREKPIVIGHSMGGLIAQLLLQRDLASAAVAIDSAPPQGIITTKWSFVRANWPHINPLALKARPIQLSFERFQYAFVNGLAPDQQRTAFDAYVVPEWRRVPMESLTKVGHIDFARPHAPLLLIAGSADHIIPAALNRTMYRRYRRGASIKDFKEFPGRTHFIIGQEGWEEVAGHAASWLEQRVQ